MSLIISLSVPDGIVVAADSLSTSQNLVEIVTQETDFKCPHCKKEIGQQELKLPPFPIPFSASSYTQKLFPLFRKYALGSFGLGIINKRSIYYHVNSFERENQEDIPESIDSVLDKLVHYFENQLLVQFPKHKEEAPDNSYPFGFHLNGFEEQNGIEIGVTHEVYLGKENVHRKRDAIGCTFGGEGYVVKKLWEIKKQDPRRGVRYGLLTLQDAIDLSEFYIDTTSTFQKFANDVPTVGGSIDIALVTPFHGFRWIKRKKLIGILEE